MAKMATPPIMDSHMANILLCYLLYRIDRPVQVSQLYDIAVGSNIINYFAYQESISYLTEHGSVQLRRMPEGVEEYVLMEPGVQTARELRNYVGKAYRDKLVSAALQYFARLKRESEVKLEYIPLKKGYYVHVRCLDLEDDLLDLKLYAPDYTRQSIWASRSCATPPVSTGKSSRRRSPIRRSASTSATIEAIPPKSWEKGLTRAGKPSIMKRNQS
ncbi:MAG: DUF4364 family protein [Ruminococcus sp.]